MLAAIAAIALGPATYLFPNGTKLGYDVTVAFDGFIPVVGGIEGTAEAKLGLEVAGTAADKDGNPRATSELKFFKLKLNGEELPFTLDNVLPFFPKNTVVLTPFGKILKTDAPDVKLPVRLPGLDAKRFPDITFLPVEFPPEGVEVGKTWTTRKPFGDSDVIYEVKPTALTDATLEMEVKVSQTLDTLEDETKNAVTDEKEAVSKVHTVMSGTGKIVFDRKLGAIRTSSVEAASVSQVVDIQTKAATERRLKMKVTVALRDKKSAPWR